MGDIGSLIDIRVGLAPTRIVAGSGDDDDFKFGPAIERSNYSAAVLHVAVAATLTAAATAIVTAKLQESADGSTGWADIAPSESATASPQTLTVTGSGEIELNYELQ